MELREPVAYRSGCGCETSESGVTTKCLRHLQADWDAARLLAATPPDFTDSYQPA